VQRYTKFFLHSKINKPDDGQGRNNLGQSKTNFLPSTNADVAFKESDPLISVSQ
jgi:hypothetical protein